MRVTSFLHLLCTAGYAFSVLPLSKAVEEVVCFTSCVKLAIVSDVEEFPDGSTVASSSSLETRSSSDTALVSSEMSWYGVRAQVRVV